jgi:hypothetical protein
MNSDRLIFEAMKVAQDLLRQNLPQGHNLTNAATVLRMRELIGSPSIRSALDRSSDTLFAFALRAVERLTSGHSQTNRETIAEQPLMATKRTYQHDLLFVRLRGETDMHQGVASTASVAHDPSLPLAANFAYNAAFPTAVC